MAKSLQVASSASAAANTLAHATATPAAGLFITQAPVNALRQTYPRTGLICREWAAMEQIFAPHVSICTLRRATPSPLQRYLAASGPTKVNERSDVLDPDKPDFEQLLQDFPQHGRAPLEAHLMELAELFATVADCQRVGIRLAITHQPMCPRFHVDRVGLRLLCTLQGPGTEWLEHADVDRRLLGFGFNGIPDAHSGLLRPGAQIHAMQASDIGLFKGELWQGNAGRGAVHRSPAVKPISPHRIMVTLDEVS